MGVGDWWDVINLSKHDTLRWWVVALMWRGLLRWDLGSFVSRCHVVFVYIFWFPNTFFWVGEIWVVWIILCQWSGILPPDARSSDSERSQNSWKCRSVGRDVTYLDLWTTSFSNKLTNPPFYGSKPKELFLQFCWAPFGLLQMNPLIFIWFWQFFTSFSW